MALNNRPKWIIATAAAIAATGVGGVALASGGGSESPLPDAVVLRDPVPVATETVQASAVASLFEVRSGPIVRAEDGSFTMQSATSDSVDTLDTVDTGDTVDAAASVASVDSVASIEAQDSVDSVASIEAVDAVESADSIDTVDTGDTANSVDSF